MSLEEDVIGICPLVSQQEAEQRLFRLHSDVEPKWLHVFLQYTPDDYNIVSVKHQWKGKTLPISSHQGTNKMEST